jgi:hypothetical protein
MIAGRVMARPLRIEYPDAWYASTKKVLLEETDTDGDGNKTIERKELNGGKMKEFKKQEEVDQLFSQFGYF